MLPLMEFGSFNIPANSNVNEIIFFNANQWPLSSKKFEDIFAVTNQGFYVFTMISRAFNIFQVYQYFTIYRWYFFLLKFEKYS
jgi:hypothetical protein